MSTKFLPQQLLLEDKTVASVSKVKVFKVSSDTPDVLFVKYDYSSDFQAIPLSTRSSRSQSQSRYSLQQLYSTALHITKTKTKNDLVSLCRSGAIPSEFHQYYEN